jgi:methylthioribose-1-phosphate isomerase
VANKIGTSGVAVLARHFGIPFFVAAPRSTIDLACANGREIVIEQRDANEVTELWYEKRMAPEGISVFNPAFDVTPAELVTAIITDKGVVYPPYSSALKAEGK